MSCGIDATQITLAVLNVVQVIWLAYIGLRSRRVRNGENHG